MDNFEKQFGNLDVQLNAMDGSTSQTTATNAPQEAVEALMKQSAKVAGILEKITSWCLLPGKTGIFCGPGKSGISIFLMENREIRVVYI